MADGAQTSRRSLVLADAAARPAGLWARCRCGRTAAVDPSAWLAEGLGGQPLDALEARLRCLCGARRARLEIQAKEDAPAGAGGIYIFR